MQTNGHAPHAPTPDPALAANITAITELAKEAGAAEAVIVRQPREAALVARWSPTQPASIHLTTHATMLLLVFAAADGGAPGAEELL